MSETPHMPSSFDSKSIYSEKPTTDTSSNLDIESQKATQTVAGPQPTVTTKTGFWSPMSRLDLKPSSQTTEDAVMGTSDGMTVPFALTASLASFAPNARYVMLAGLAELTAGAISMALGGLLQARCEAESYQATFRDTKAKIEASSQEVVTIIDDLFAAYKFAPETLTLIKRDLAFAPIHDQTKFVVKFYYERSEPDNGRPLKSAGTLGICYFLSGLLGLIPYICVPRPHIKTALFTSVGIEAVALTAFGYAKTGVNVGWKTRENVWKATKGAFLMVFVGAVAAGIAVGLIIWVNKGQHVTA